MVRGLEGGQEELFNRGREERKKRRSTKSLSKSCYNDVLFHHTLHSRPIHTKYLTTEFLTNLQNDKLSNFEVSRASQCSLHLHICSYLHANSKQYIITSAVVDWFLVNLTPREAAG